MPKWTKRIIAQSKWTHYLGILSLQLQCHEGLTDVPLWWTVFGFHPEHSNLMTSNSLPDRAPRSYKLLLQADGREIIHFEMQAWSVKMFCEISKRHVLWYFLTFLAEISCPLPLNDLQQLAYSTLPSTNTTVFGIGYEYQYLSILIRIIGYPWSYCINDYLLIFIILMDTYIH